MMLIKKRLVLEKTTYILSDNFRMKFIHNMTEIGDLSYLVLRNRGLANVLNVLKA